MYSRSKKCREIVMRKIYLLTTEHLEEGLWFRDEEDFKTAMNYIAIEAVRHPEVVVLAFILMSNHVHFILNGKHKDVESFINCFKHRYSIYYRRKYGVKEFLRRNGLDIREVPFEDEAPEKGIAYVQMNCVAANICTHPSQYPWGTGNVFFNPTPLIGGRLGDMSVRVRNRLLHSDSDCLPNEWIVGSDGYIPPQNFVNISAVERIFRTPQRMNFFYRNSSKAKKRFELSDNLPAFRDQTILAALPDLCRSLFQKDSFTQLQIEEQTEFARQIRFRFSADANQIARVCGITYSDAARLLDSV